MSRSVAIPHGCEFKTSNNMLKSMVGYWLEKGDEDIKHYDGIEEEDERRMYAYFDRTTPIRLGAYMMRCTLSCCILDFEDVKVL